MKLFSILNFFSLASVLLSAPLVSIGPNPDAIINSEDKYLGHIDPAIQAEIVKAHQNDIQRVRESIKAVDAQLAFVLENIINLNTPGYKRISILWDFNPLSENSKTSPLPKRQFIQGALQATGNKLDVAITTTEGLFMFTEKDGKNIFRRNGNFLLNTEGFFTDSSGNLLFPKIQVRPGTFIDQLMINEEGVVRTVNKDGKIEQVGTLKVFAPDANNDLNYLPQCNCFKPAKARIEIHPLEVGAKWVNGFFQGFIEMSNVNETEERANQIVLLRHRAVLTKTLLLLRKP